MIKILHKIFIKKGLIKLSLFSNNKNFYNPHTFQLPMPTQDTLPIKEKILETLREKGPSLPVHISREINQSSLFTSAFLSELLSEKRIKISNMKVGTSPIYYAPGTESQLEKYSEHLKQKEKEAFMLLQEKKFLKDSEQEPAIRVALRAIKDFSKPFETQKGEFYWRYFNIPEEEFDSYFSGKKTKTEVQKEEPDNKTDTLDNQEKDSLKELDIFDDSLNNLKNEDNSNKKEENQQEIKKTSSTKSPKTTKKLSKKISKKSSSKKSTNDKFFNKVKEFLNQKSIEITDIVSVGKNELTFIVKNNSLSQEDKKEKLLFAFNKKRVSENDLIKANKKASELQLEYIILSLGEPLKRLTNLIDAIKNLSDIEKVE